MPDVFDHDDLARLRIALARIGRTVDRQVRGDAMTRTQVSVLGTVSRLGPIAMGELAEIEGVNPTMLSRIVGKLENGGLLARETDPGDRRVVRVAATEHGLRTQEHLRSERTRVLGEHLRRMPESHGRDLLDALPAIEALADVLGPRPVRDTALADEQAR
ncbi:DNA-binding MarR family transcriptional regulator [Pseudonocardia sediminis]|uniref:DNA-binding MarR family transcriptional regulator n=1 Tax=Pseudonocardia sediminis TaxID=1397368 RepID=A0A4Q7UX39_PSEST|nr:MarR family transcriptional regulator [Pseudonocardia sediminis]RZT86617.1 DNA-binding MarR family transcriptional regulator [Pseudonocardia sediminis]